MSITGSLSISLILSFAPVVTFAQQDFPYNPASPQKQSTATQIKTQQPTNQQAVIEDPAQLVGKKINVNRLPLCEPGTYKGDLTHAGLEATVLSAKPSKTPALSKSVLDKLSPELRDMMLDQQKAALLVLRFDDGVTRDTCAAIGPRKLSEYVEMANGQKLEPNTSSSATTATQTAVEPVPNVIGEPSKSPGGKWTVEPLRDKLTDVVSKQFNLMANNTVHDGIATSRPVLAIVCRAGHIKEAELQTGVVLSTPAIEERGLLNVHVPVHYVRVRLDKKIDTYSWEQLADSKTMEICCNTFSGKHQVEKIVDAHDVRIEFGSFDGYAEVAEFSPAGIDKNTLRQSCGLKL
jgi:hypothetical protein